jgi:hypothetical protein
MLVGVFTPVSCSRESPSVFRIVRTTFRGVWIKPLLQPSLLLDFGPIATVEFDGGIGWILSGLRPTT